MNYVTAKEIKSKFKITGVTLMKWKNEGRLSYKRLSDKKFSMILILFSMMKNLHH